MKYDLEFDPVLMNAAGSLGFAPDPNSAVELAGLGAFVTNPVSLASRSPARGARILDYPGGFLLHTGYPNPGLKEVLRRYASRWMRSPLPVLVHLLAQAPGELETMVAALEDLPGLAGIEVGLPPDVDAPSAVEFARAAMGELPVVLRVPLDNATRLAPALRDIGLAAISLAPPRGALVGPDGKLVSGRLYGPAVFPLALGAVHDLAVYGVPVFAAGGVYKHEHAQTLLAAGAVAVQLDAVLWRGGW